jgi:hypothetical protein
MRSDDCTEPGRSTSSRGPGTGSGAGLRSPTSAEPVQPSSAASTVSRVRAGDTSPTRTRSAPAGRTRAACSDRSAGALTTRTSSGSGVCTAYGWPSYSRHSSAFRAACAGWEAAISMRSARRSRSAFTSAVGYVAWVSTSASTSSSRGSPVEIELPETSSRSGSTPTASPPPTSWSAAAMSTVDIVSVPESIVWERTADRVRCVVPRWPGAGWNGMRRRTSTSGTEGRRTTSTRRPFASTRSATAGRRPRRGVVSSGRVRG